MSQGSDKQPTLYIQNDVDSRPRAVMDPDEISRSGAIEVRDFAVSPDGRWLAYAMAPGGADASETHVRELTSGRQLEDVVAGVLGTVCWTQDGGGFFYVAAARHDALTSSAGSRIEKQLAYHKLGQLQSQDRRIHEWTDNYRWAYVMLSEDRRRVLVVAERGSASELYTIDLGDPKHPNVTGNLQLRLGGGHSYTPIGTIGSALYVLTNLDAPRRRLAALDLTDRASTLRTIVAESQDVVEDAALTADRIAVHYLEDVRSRLRLFAIDGQPAGEIVLPGVGSIAQGLSARSSSADVFYGFTTFLTPTTVYRYDVRRGASTPFRPPRAAFDANAFETKQVFYSSKDGTRVPMFITAKKGVALDGKNSTLLTGYGGYGISQPPTYQADVIVWLQSGGVYAVANIRGGGEYGEEWHRAGMLDRKQNSFDDFIGAAQCLIDEGYTSPARLAIYGYSNGGLLVGAVLTQRPDLFTAAVANAGHYDMLRYHLFTVGAGWIPEYGSPEDPEAFRHLIAYSPLHNVRLSTCYPSTLLLAADHDDRVVPSHTYKFAATLQAAQRVIDRFSYASRAMRATATRRRMRRSPNSRTCGRSLPRVWASACVDDDHGLISPSGS